MHHVVTSNIMKMCAFARVARRASSLQQTEAWQLQTTLRQSSPMLSVGLVQRARCSGFDLFFVI